MHKPIHSVLKSNLDPYFSIFSSYNYFHIFHLLLIPNHFSLCECLGFPWIFVCHIFHKIIKLFFWLCCEFFWFYFIEKTLLLFLCIFIWYFSPFSGPSLGLWFSVYHWTLDSLFLTFGIFLIFYFNSFFWDMVLFWFSDFVHEAVLFLFVWPSANSGHHSVGFGLYFWTLWPSARVLLHSFLPPFIYHVCYLIVPQF